MKKKFCSPMIVIVCLCVALGACGTHDVVTPDEFAPFISAYSGGLLHAGSSVVIELAETPDGVVAGTEIKEKLFSFSPALKGKTYWADERTVEFVPDDGALKNGKIYKGKFNLAQVVKTDKRYRTFRFTFRVEDKQFYVRIGPPEIADTLTVDVEGVIVASDEVDLETMKKALKCTLSNRQTVEAAVESVDNRTFDFKIVGIERTKTDSRLEISLNEKILNATSGITTESVTIPALGVFKVLSAEPLLEPEHGAEIVFSQSLSTSQDLKGLITLDGVETFTVKAEKNRIALFFGQKEAAKITVAVDRNIKSNDDKTLDEDFVTELTVGRLKPQVELFDNGNILPNSNNLTFPFRAVNLRAVDLRIVRIYETNVLMFLQANRLGGANELARVGRLMYQKTLPLDSHDAVQHRWQNYAIDLTDIIKQAPGAIYRIELSFKQAYSTYECDDDRPLGHSADEIVGKNVGQKTGNLTRLIPDDAGVDDGYWDSPNYYYYQSGNYDWELYDWREIDNPCHPSYYMGSDKNVSCNVMTSNLGVIAKVNAENKIWVSVADILDTKPVANANISVYNYQLQVVGNGKTDSEGFAVIEPKGKPFVLVAENRGQKTYLRMVDGESNSLSRFDVAGKTVDKGIKGYIYGERGVWRPGDTLHISFVLYDPEKRLPDHHPVSFEVYNPLGQFYAKQTSSKSVNGFYTFALPTSTDDPTGLWNVTVKLGGASFYKSLRIETVKPNRLKVDLDLHTDRIDAYRKQQMPAILTSAWLTGATARNLKAKVEMTLSKAKTQFKGYEKYLFNSPATTFYTYEADVFEGTLNEEGIAKFDVKLPPAENAPGMLNAHFVSRIFEPGGDASVFTQSMPYSPFESYVGLNPNTQEGKPVETDVVHTFDVVSLNPDGKPVDGKHLEYKIYKVGWSWWWERDSESFADYVNNTSYQPVSSGNIRTSNGKGSFNFVLKYPDWGRFLVYVKDTDSGHSTGSVVYIDWPAYRGRSNKADPNGVKMLTFSTDKPSYEVGETVEVIIPASAGGTALIALENGSSVISRNRVAVKEKEDTKYTFKVSEEMTPNCYIHISLLQPHAQTVNDLPIRMYGVLPVMVTNRASHLTPQIQLPDVLRPETEFTVKVSEKNGKPMTYTLAIVDDGLLDLTNFKTPNPWDEFYAREALGIRTWDMYDNIIGAFGGKLGGLFSVGGDEEIRVGNQKANRFKPVVRFMGPFTLSGGKTGSHKIKLPMYVGSVRTMVVAGQNGAFGHAEKTTPVRSPLMALPSLPRVLSVNEEIDLPVNVFAMESNVKQVTVKVETQNGLLLPNEKDTKTIAFGQPGDESVYFRMKTSDRTGTEKVTVTVSGNGYKATETIEINVRNPHPPIVTAESKLLEAGQSGEFSYRLTENSADNWVRLEASRIPAVDISRRFDFLLNYTHLCSEQIASRAFPLLFIAQFRDVGNDEATMLKANIRQAIQNLYGRQRSDGGFLYWPNYAVANDWVSSYVGHFLVKAKEKGYEVNVGVLNKWKNYQRDKARKWSVDGRDADTKRYSELMQAYRLYTLAMAGASESGAMNRLKEDKTLTVQARWVLAAAYAITGRTAAADELIFNIPVTAENRRSGDNYGSALRDEAMIVETLTLMNRLEEAFKQAQRVSKRLSNELYFSTQSTAYALSAMGLLAEKTSGVTDYSWTVNGKKQSDVKSPKSVVQTDLISAVTKGSVTVKNNQKGLLYVTLVSKTSPPNDTLPATANRLKLDVSYTDMNGSPLDVATLKQGTDFIAAVKVTNTSPTENYTDVALTQMIPAGWEIFNQRMFGAGAGGGNAAGYNYQDIRDDAVMTYFDLNKNSSVTYKVRLQASYAGEFNLPAVQCEAMYDPSARARTKAGRVKVVR